MKVPKYNLVRHITFIIFLTALLTLGIAYPFLKGDYDRLAIPISTMIQVFGLVGLSLVPVGILWATMSKYRFGFTIAAIIVSSVIVMILALFATLSVGKSFGLLTLLLWIIVAILLIPQIKKLKGKTANKMDFLPFYLICLPIITLLLQLTLAKPLTQLSRNRAIENAYRFIRHIEEYQTLRGAYPLTLQAQNKDYYPDVAGVEKYLYAPHRKGYNLSFEQPRFLLDRFGTREWVVYNPLDENSVYSHTSWLLPTEQEEASQGWYASGNTGHKHWKYFLFD
ncbi:hypothetical protein [Niabella aquatica]